jgi:hypothetical protein
MGESAQLRFAPKNSGEFLPIWVKFPLNSKFFGWTNGRNLPNLVEIRPEFLKANLNCADLPGSPEKYLLCSCEESLCKILKKYFFWDIGRWVRADFEHKKWMKMNFYNPKITFVIDYSTFLVFFVAQFVNLNLFWYILSWKDQNALDLYVDILKENLYENHLRILRSIHKKYQFWNFRLLVNPKNSLVCNDSRRTNKMLKRFWKAVNFWSIWQFWHQKLNICFV